MSEEAQPTTVSEAPRTAAGFLRGLSGKLLLLTIVFVMLAEVLIFVPSVANMRIRWLQDRLNTVAAAAVVVDGLQNVELPRNVQDDTLMATGTKAIVIRRKDASRMIAAADMPSEIDGEYDTANFTALAAIRDAFDTLLFGGNRVVRVYGPLGESDAVIELVMADASLHKAMLVYSRNVFFLSIIISLITATLIFLAINRMLIVPIRRMTASMQEFSNDPSNPARVLVPPEGRDELAVAGQHLASMQRELQKTLKQQKSLAELGLAVSKINHDMRNILSSAQLISDRLADVDDPVVKRFAPTLLRAIDRAVGYTREVLSYGRTTEAEPHRRFVALKPLVSDVAELLSIDPQSGIEFQIQVQDDLEVDADSEQLFRVVHNICRNAVQALTNHEAEDGRPRVVSVSAMRMGSVVTISVDDTGPGMPAKARENLFAAFRGSARSGGTGLGLAIARELVLAHGGTIALVEKPTPGTLFRIELPDRPVPLDAFRSKARH
ncbi:MULTISPECIES: HAMP domain-containing sensor histidine kinase [Ensifer]|jgi:signal transduction histidine kinase|uniref:histidine kinase n=1 Tax=Ensifer canadensis TaxID=555315 RepID=A0AAW4FDC7_9HYPH|nr:MULTISPECIES: HAMP domain-containing sensor histidine kinase [Ensifer]AHK43256.1 two component sensor histidine kinase protein [Ensifer adhaerens OV14]MDP9628587.1 signal transduction histidine kinase [Ensifer adhaerens]KQU98249.1 histidine kinase [Ensifer sp. Root31]KQW63007.1 histidine kinase [Ensifer sp. Root1252]KQW85023.1 histidine kinase [Ensifer sp. Root127]